MVHDNREAADGPTNVSYGRRFDAALVLASQLHVNQFRKGKGVPYVTHLLAVAALVGEAGGTEDEVIAALQHDAVEDQGGQATLTRIEALFGENVGQIVLGCSDTDVVPKPPWQQRKEEYIAHLRDAPPSVLLVSCADKLHNARDLLADFREFGDDIWSRFNATKEQALWYYETLAGIYIERGVAPRLAGELDRIVQTLVSESR